MPEARARAHAACLLYQEKIQEANQAVKAYFAHDLAVVLQRLQEIDERRCTDMQEITSFWADLSFELVAPRKVLVALAPNICFRTLQITLLLALRRMPCKYCRRSAAGLHEKN